MKLVHTHTVKHSLTHSAIINIRVLRKKKIFFRSGFGMIAVVGGGCGGTTTDCSVVDGWRWCVPEDEWVHTRVLFLLNLICCSFATALLSVPVSTGLSSWCGPFFFLQFPYWSSSQSNPAPSCALLSSVYFPVVSMKMRHQRQWWWWYITVAANQLW